MKYRMLGANGPRVSAVALGTMAMSGVYGPSDEAEAIAAIHRAIDLGITLIDTAEAYGTDGHNERLVGRALRGRRDKVVLSTKVGGGPALGLGRPDYIRRAIDASLARLGVDYVDVYSLHRVDPTTPIEDSVGAMAEAVAAGKTRYLGLSEAGPETIRRAHAVHSMTSLQTEYSLWTRDVETAVLPAIRALHVGLMAYSPLGRGFLAGELRRADDLPANDRRREHPRFQGDNFRRNLELADALRALAAARGVTSGQLALAWLLHRGEDVVPLFGARRGARVDENVAAVDVALTPQEIQRLDALFASGVAAGARYPESAMRRVEWGVPSTR
jgi:aryl-alcohol dehydrogenase-like predicted oxidoreductase